MVADERIGDILVAQGHLTREEAEVIASERLRSDSRFLSIALRTGRITEAQALEALSLKSGYPHRDLNTVVIPKSVLRLIPFEIARKQLLLPFAIEDRNLLLAMADPVDLQIIEEVSFATGLVVRPHIALHAQLATAIIEAHCTSGEYYYGPAVSEQDRHVDVEQNPIEQDYAPFPTQAPPPRPNPTNISAIDNDINEPKERLDAAPLKAALKTILVVEDDPQIQELILKVLQKLNYRVISASRGLQALKLIQLEKPDLIVLDAMLPEVHGFEICRKIKESKRFCHTPVLMLSAIYRGWRIAEDIKSTYGVDDFLEKPFRSKELLNKIEILMQKRQSNNPNEPPPMNLVATRFFEQAIKDLDAQDYANAFKKLRQAEELEPFSPRVQFALGQVLEKDNRTFQSMYHYERAIELDPSMYAAAQNLAMLYQSKGFKRKAVEMWERALLSAPNSDVRDNIKQHLVKIL